MTWLEKVLKVKNAFVGLHLLRLIYSEMNDLVDEMISEVDDGDGEIDYEEFVKMIQKY